MLTVIAIGIVAYIAAIQSHEVLGHGHGHIGLEQRPADVAHGFADVVRRQAALSAQRAEDGLEPFSKRLEHGDPKR